MASAARYLAKFVLFVGAVAIGVNADRCKDICDLDCDTMQKCEINERVGPDECTCKADETKIVFLMLGIICFAALLDVLRRRREPSTAVSSDGQSLSVTVHRA